VSNLLLSTFRRRFSAPPPAAFDPTDWSGCTLDLVAEDCNPTSNPSPWASRVGATTFTASGAARPTAGTALNGKATLRFSGAQNFTTTALMSSVVTDSNDYTIFLVMVPKGYTNAADFTSYTNGDVYFSDTGEYLCIGGTSSGGGQVYGANYSGGYGRARRTLAVDTPVVLCYRGDSASGQSQLGLNDQAPGGTGASSDAGTLNLEMRIGGGTLPARFGNFELARLFVYSRSLSDVERDEVIAAAMAEYGIATLAWEPTTPETPNRWLSVELGRIWQDTAGTISATAPGQPVARIDARNGTNFTQSGGTLQPYLAVLGDGFGVRTDDVDDNIGVTESFSAGAKTFACIFEIFSAPSTTGNETILRVGVTPQQVIVRHSGLTASGAKGFHFAVDRSSTTGVCIQPTGGAALLSNGIHTLVLRYDGTGTASAAAYRAWLDGVEVSLTTGGNVAASGNSRWLATSVPSEPCNSAVRAHLLFTSALSVEDCVLMASFLEGMRSLRAAFAAQKQPFRPSWASSAPRRRVEACPPALSMSSSPTTTVTWRPPERTGTSLFLSKGPFDPRLALDLQPCLPCRM